MGVQCERCYDQARSGGWMSFLATVLVGALSPVIERHESETHGRELVVYTPIRLCKEFHGRFCKAVQRRLRRLLRTVPVYGQLLDEHPSARILLQH